MSIFNSFELKNTNIASELNTRYHCKPSFISLLNKYCILSMSRIKYTDGVPVNQN